MAALLVLTLTLPWLAACSVGGGLLAKNAFAFIFCTVMYAVTGSTAPGAQIASSSLKLTSGELLRVGGPRAGVADALTMRLEGFVPRGTIPGNKLPKWTSDLHPSLATKRAPRTSGASFDVTVSVLALTNDLEPAATSFQNAKATLYRIDRKGKARKIGTKSATADPENGGATITFARARSPQSHYRIEVTTSNGNVSGGRLMYLGLVSRTGTLGRIGTIALRSMIRSSEAPEELRVRE